MSATFNPAGVMMSQQASTGKPYLQASPVRATGSGPFDQSYRQNLATYAAGQFAPSSAQGTFFNPTSPANFGNPVGAGNAPVQGLPTTLLGQAMGGSPAQTAPPTTSASANQPKATGPSMASPGGLGNLGNLNSWLEQFMSGFQLPGVGTNG